jgi:hypothetical protein
MGGQDSWRRKFHISRYRKNEAIATSQISAALPRYWGLVCVHLVFWTRWTMPRWIYLLILWDWPEVCVDSLKSLEDCRERSFTLTEFSKFAKEIVSNNKICILRR